MQTAARSLSEEPVSIALLRWLQGCSVSGSKPGHAALRAPHSSEAWRCRTCPVPAPPPDAVVWTGRALSSTPTRCAIWRLAIVLISLVQGCYPELMQWLIWKAQPWSLDRWYGAAFPATWLCGFVAESLWGRWSVPVRRQEKPTTA
jgi:hypothetical protein